MSQDIVDSLDSLRWIAALRFVDPSNLHLLGISMGAVISSVVAAETDAIIRSLTRGPPPRSLSTSYEVGNCRVAQPTTSGRGATSTSMGNASASVLRGRVRVRCLWASQRV